MCLGIPGRVATLERDPDGLACGVVDFEGVAKRVCLAYVPEAAVGDYVVVHAGFAISRLDPAEARKTFAYLEEAGELRELEPPP